MIKKALDFIFDNSLLLIVGAIAGLLWANLDLGSYHGFIGKTLLTTGLIGTPHDGTHVIDLHFLVNDVLMALFFLMAGRQVWESLLPGGALSSVRRGALPIVCAAGGMVGPALLYIVGVALMGQLGPLHRGWAIPTATDIAFSYLAARIIFGATHPAIAFLLMLAIVDDALGLLVLTVFYPQEPVNGWYLLLVLAGVALGAALWKMRVKDFWWYLLGPGALSWLGFAMSGLHPALGLLPIIPIIPHMRAHLIRAGWDFITPATAEELDYWLKRPVEVLLGLFGLFNAGVPLGQVSMLSVVVLVALIAGKPLGISLTAVLCVKFAGLQLPRGLRKREFVVMGIIAGIGFTVALFVTTVAFAPGPVQDAAKMGALASFCAAFLGLLAAKLLRVQRAAPPMFVPEEENNA